MAFQCLTSGYERLKETTYATRIKEMMDQKDWLELEKLVTELS